MTAVLVWLRHHWRLVRLGAMTGDQAAMEVMLYPCRCGACRSATPTPETQP